MKIPKEMIDELAARFPDKHIIKIPEHSPEEVICELMKAPDGAWSIAVALIGKSVPHYHLETKEFYFVVKGSLNLFTGVKGMQLCYARVEMRKEKSASIIHPGTVHWVEAIGMPSEVFVFTSPAWEADDHHLFEG